LIAFLDRVEQPSIAHSLGHEQPLTYSSHPTTLTHNWIGEKFLINHHNLINVITLHLDFGILQQEPIKKLISPSHLARFQNIQVQANQQALQFLNHIADKHTNQKLQDLVTKYFVMKSLKDYVRLEG
jgi:hypothetical protein